MEHAANVGADAFLDVVEGAVVPVLVPGVPTERLSPRRCRRGGGDCEEEEDAEEEGRRHGRRGKRGAGNPLDWGSFAVAGYEVVLGRRRRGQSGRRHHTVHGECGRAFAVSARPSSL